MGKLIASNWMTLDGKIAGSSGEMDWILGDAQMGAYELELVGKAEIMVFGGKTYREFSAHWPKVPDSPASNPFERDFAAKINPLKKAVFSSTMSEPLWNGTTFYRDIDINQIRKLKEDAQGSLVMYGSASLISPLTESRLIDEYHVVIHPILIGAGLSYFGDLKNRVSLKRIGCEPLDSGAVILKYSAA